MREFPRYRSIWIKYTEGYASSQIDDKNLDRNFKKEHSDLEPHVDALYKLFRRRPRVQKRPVVAGVADDATLGVFPMVPQSIIQVCYMICYTSIPYDWDSR